MRTPQVIMIAIIIVRLIIAFYWDGMHRINPTYSAKFELWRMVTLVTLLLWGGFFK